MTKQNEKGREAARGCQTCSHSVYLRRTGSVAGGINWLDDLPLLPLPPPSPWSSPKFFFFFFYFSFFISSSFVPASPSSRSVIILLFFYFPFSSYSYYYPRNSKLKVVWRCGFVSTLRGRWLLLTPHESSNNYWLATPLLPVTQCSHPTPLLSPYLNKLPKS